MARAPAVSAGIARDSFAFYERAYPDLHRHLRRTLPEEVLDRLDHAPRTEWIPVDLDGHYVDGVLLHLGVSGTKDAIRRFCAQSLVGSGIIRGVVDGLTRIFGLGLGALLRGVPAGFDQGYREAFVLQSEYERRAAHFAFRDIAPALLQFKAYPVVWEGIFLGIYDIARTAPQLELELKAEERRLDVRLSW